MSSKIHVILIYFNSLISKSLSLQRRVHALFDILN